MTAASSHSAMDCGNINCDAWGHRHEPPCRVQPARQPVQCQGCGGVRDGSWLGRAHDCWVNEDGSREEGGTFQ